MAGTAKRETSKQMAYATLDFKMVAIARRISYGKSQTWNLDVNDKS